MDFPPRYPHSKTAIIPQYVAGREILDKLLVRTEGRGRERWWWVSTKPYPRSKPGHSASMTHALSTANGFVKHAIVK